MQGLVVEGATWTDMIREVRLVLPDLLEMEGRAEAASPVFKAEDRLDLAAALMADLCRDIATVSEQQAGPVGEPAKAATRFGQTQPERVA